MNKLKQQFFEGALELGKVRVYYVPWSSLVLPEPYDLNPAPLDYELNVPNPIWDLKVDEHGLEATLSFGGRPTYTYIPWDCVAGLQLDEMALVRFVVVAETPRAIPAQSGKAPAPRKRGHLVLVK